MNLADIEWPPFRRTLPVKRGVRMASLKENTVRIYAVDGNNNNSYTIYVGPPAHVAREEWLNLDAITAQAVLYELLK